MLVGLQVIAELGTKYFADRDEAVWKFVFNQEDLREDFIKTEGSWVFDGAKPEYKWEEKNGYLPERLLLYF